MALRSLAGTLAFVTALIGCAAGVRADVIQPWNEVPSGLCPEGSRHSAHSGQCIVRECRRARPGAPCERISLCVTTTGGRLANQTYLVASRTCDTQSDCPPASDCRPLDVVAGRDPPVAQVALGCCTAFVVAGAAATFLLVRTRARRRALRNGASASRDGRVG